MTEHIIFVVDTGQLNVSFTNTCFIKVHLQTQQLEKVKATTLVVRILKTDGVLGLYNGLSASICRQVPDTLFNIFSHFSHYLDNKGNYYAPMYV